MAATLQKRYERERTDLFTGGFGYMECVFGGGGVGGSLCGETAWVTRWMQAVTRPAATTKRA